MVPRIAGPVKRWPQITPFIRALLTAATAIIARSTLGVIAAPGETTLEDYGGAGDGTTDNTPALNAIIAAGVRTVRLGAGKVYRFSSAVSTITYGLRLIGSGKSTTVLDFYQTTGQCLYYTGTTDAGGHLEGFTLRNRGASTLTAGIYLQAQAGGGSPDFCVLRDINITGATASDLFSYGVLIDGNARTTGIIGIRDICVDNVSIFNTTAMSFEVRHGKDVSLKVSCFATGTGGVNAGQITGSSGSVPSGAVRLSANMGDLTLGFCASVDVEGVYDDITVDAGASAFNIKGVATSVTVNAAASNGRLAVQGGATIVNGSATTVGAETHGIALSDEITAITTGTNKATFSLPYAFKVTAVYATLNTASSSGIPTVDINEAGTTILSTKLTIDANEKTSATAAAAAVISDTAIAANAEIGFDIDVAGTGAKGLKVFIQGYRT